MVSINNKKIPKQRDILSKEGLKVFNKIHKKIDVIARC